MPFTFYKLVLLPDQVTEDGMPVYRAEPYITLYDGMVEIALSPGQAQARREAAPQA